MMIRPELSADVRRIYDVTQSAFPTPDEAELVNRLRADGDSIISLVAVEADRIIGHAVFSKMEAPFKALGLGPVSVVPEAQGAGVGSALINAGIELARAKGLQCIFCLGDPNYYQRFGFSVSQASDFASPYVGPHFMALFLDAGLSVRQGPVAYAPAFGALG